MSNCAVAKDYKLNVKSWLKCNLLNINTAKFFLVLTAIFCLLSYVKSDLLLAQSNVQATVETPFNMTDFDLKNNASSDFEELLEKDQIPKDPPEQLDAKSSEETDDKEIKSEESTQEDGETDASKVTIVEDFITQQIPLKKDEEPLDQPFLADIIPNSPQTGLLDGSKKIVEDANTKILDVVVSADRIEPSQTQWIEVYVQNLLKASRPLYVKLDLILPNGRLLSLGRLAVVLPATAVKNIIFRYKIPPRSGGVYVIKPSVYSRKNKLLAVAKKRFEFFVLGEPQAFARGSQFGAQQNLTNSVNKDPKVGFTNIEFEKKYAIATDVIKASASLKNSGKTNLTNVSFNVYLVSEQHNFAPIGAALYEEIGLKLAPGERRIFRFNVLLPDNINFGNYLLLGVLEDNQTPLEFNQLDNFALSQNMLTVDQIVLDSPLDQSTINLNSIINFTWRAIGVKDFFLQISVDRSFEDPSQSIRIPQDSTTNKNSLESFLAENSITSILKDNQVDTPLYWRVVGSDDLGLPIFSKANVLFYRID